MIDIRDDSLSNFKYYRYDPSMGAAVLFIILFLATTILHFFQMIRTRTWFLIPFCIGGTFETIGYIGRAVSAQQTPNWTIGPYVIQSILLLVAPALLAASIYMELARIVLMVEGDHALFIRRSWLTRIFVTGDVLSFFMQAAGGGLLASKSSSSINTGENVILGGLALQLIFFFLFIVAGAIFHFRIVRKPTNRSASLPWAKHMWSLYAVSILIFIRCLVRLIEYGQGWTGYIISHEAFLYIFDALLMWLAVLVMNTVHPSEVRSLIRGKGQMVVSLVRVKDVTVRYSNVHQLGPWS